MVNRPITGTVEAILSFIDNQYRTEIHQLQSTVAGLNVKSSIGLTFSISKAN
jgi:hypothetical protein